MDQSDRKRGMKTRLELEGVQYVCKGTTIQQNLSNRSFFVTLKEADFLSRPNKTISVHVFSDCLRLSLHISWLWSSLLVSPPDVVVPKKRERKRRKGRGRD